MDSMRTFDVNGKALTIASNQQETSIPAASEETPTAAPGAGKFMINSLQLASDKIAPGASLDLSAQISGENTGFIYSELLFHDPQLGQYYGPLVKEVVLSENSSEVEGVLMPAWNSPITINLSITPTLRILTSGLDAAFAFFEPEGYGKQAYLLEGLYTRAGSDHARRAMLKFDSSGEFINALVFKEGLGHSTPRALTLKPGDQFSPYVQLVKNTGDENLPIWQLTRGQSNTLTCGETAFRWVSADLLPGDYLLGLLVQDLDGEQTRQYGRFKVE